MSVSSQRGHIAWAVQTQKAGTATGFATGNISTDWQRHRAESVTLGVNDLYDVLPLEVGGSLFVNSSYKNGAFVAGGARLFSRLQGTIGYLIHGAAGKASQAATGNGTTVPYKTRFEVNPSDETQMPWMALRKFTPASQGATGITEYFIDCRLNMLTISVPAMGPVMMEFMVVGRKPELDDGEGVTQADIAFESGTSLAHGCKGEITLSGFTGNSLPFLSAADGKFTSAQIMIANNISQPDQQMIIGSYHPDDLVPLSRAVQLRLIYKWQDPKLYKKLYYGGGSGNDVQWSPVVGNSPISVKSTSVTNIAGASVPYSFEFVAGDVDWTMTPPQLAGNNLLFCEFTGIVKGGNNPGTPAWYIDLVNMNDYSELTA